MAKRLTIEERQARKIITDNLNAIGRKVIVISSRNSKVSKLQKDHLRDSGNYRVRPYNVLTVSQNFYGKYNTPKGKPTPKDRSNIKDTPLRNSILENVPAGIEVIKKDLIVLLKSPILNKK